MFAIGIHRSYVLICIMPPSHDSRMPYGIKLRHRRDLLLWNDANCLAGCFRNFVLAWSCGYQKHGMDKKRLGSVRLASRVNLSTEIGSSRSRLGEVAREDRLDERAEDNLSTTWKRQLIVVSARVQVTYEVWGRAIHRTRTNLNV